MTLEILYYCVDLKILQNVSKGRHSFASLRTTKVYDIVGMTLNSLLLPRYSSFLALQVIWGSLVSAVAYFLSLRARNSMNFQPICKILVSKII